MKFSKRFALRALVLPVVSIFIGGCAGEKEAIWALNYATISNSNDLIEGVHVWTFFDEDWDLTDDSYVCAVVQLVEGTSSASPDGCPGVTHSFSWTLTTISSDCPDYLAGDPFLTDRITGGCIGEIPPSIMDESPHDSQTEGWYILDENEEVIPHGFIYPEALDLGETAPDEPWEGGELLKLSPAWAWAL
jgi:hypothetical protein